MIRSVLLLALVTLISACTPADERYCAGFGVQGTSEYGRCLDYFHAQEKAFTTDRASCESVADRTYPQSLYDTGHMVQTFTPGVFASGPYVYYGGTQIIDIPPDYQHNQEVDRLRMRIIGPCMKSRGWNSPDTWQAGQHPVKTAPQTRRSKAALPWK